MEINATVIVGGKESKLTLRFDSAGEAMYRQWGAPDSQLGETVELAMALRDALDEWGSDELCRTCRDCLLDDGEGFDGECGNCADQTEGRRQDGEEAGSDVHV